MHTKKELDERLSQAGISPLKKLGQNFLVNANICSKILEASLENSPQTLVEIGPGLGALTDSILNFKGRVILVELDSGLVEYWKKKFSELNLKHEILHQDALKLNWQELNLSHPSCLMSNLPYSIAASLVIELSSFQPLIFDSLVLMFQKEVAERFAARPGEDDYALPSVVAQAFWDIEKVIDAGPQDFHPVPNVGSRVLRFKAKKSESMDGFNKGFIVFAKLAFSQRRKKLLKNLTASFDEASLKSAFEKLDINTDARAQELSPEKFKELFLTLKKVK